MRRANARRSLVGMTKASPSIRPLALGEDAMWQAVEARDADFDGRFVFAVRTTGVYCRPSCAARRPLRANVSFHASAADAEAAGFRPCKRCQPREASHAAVTAARIAAACRMIETAECPPSLAALAAACGLSRHHFQRTFAAVTGVSPKAYAAEVRARRLRELLPLSATVTEAAHAAGYNGNARFYAAAKDTLGMTPRDFRDGGDQLTLRWSLGDCALGKVLVAASHTGIAAILIGEDRDALLGDLARRFPRANIVAAGAEFSGLLQATIDAIAEPRRAADLPLDVRGTAFQRRVWQALREVPCGETISYAELAARIGAPKAVRAVAGACGANPLAVVVPCHRVVGSDGKLTGYRWGLEKKRLLLEREASARETDADTSPLHPAGIRRGARATKP